LLPSGPGGVHKSLLRWTQLSTSLHVRQALQQSIAAHEEFSPAVADCGRQGTATSPPSTTSFTTESKLMTDHQYAACAVKEPYNRNCILQELLEPACASAFLNSWRRGWDSNPRYPCGVHTLSRRADSTSSRTSPHTVIPEPSELRSAELPVQLACLETWKLVAEGEGFEPPRNLLGP
jgi:hypothetical protein